MPDEDLQMKANALMGAAFDPACERCIAISVAVLVTDALIEIIILKIIALNVAPKTDKASETGPLVTEQHLAEVRGYITRVNRKAQRLLRTAVRLIRMCRVMKAAIFLEGHCWTIHARHDLLPQV